MSAMFVYGNQPGCTVTLPLVVVEGAGPPLYGHNWLAHILINWQEIKKVKAMRNQKQHQRREFDVVISRYPELW